MLARVIVFFVRSYQKFLSPLKGQCCRFYPSCSQYMIDSVKKYGAAKGLGFGLWRLLRCNPYCKGGFDPVR